MQKSTMLKSALQVAGLRAKAIAKEAARQEAARRFDPTAYTCRREGAAWIAEGPAGNLFRFTKAPNGEDVDCLSHTGGLYTLAMDDDARWCCTCPDAAKRPDRPGGCKHVVALHSVSKAAVEAKAALSEPAKVA